MFGQHRQADFLHLAFVFRRRACVINHPIVCAFARVASRAKKDHHVIRKFLHPGLVKKQQVAGLQLIQPLPIARDELGVVILQGFGVGELGKPVGQVAFCECAELRPKEPFAERIFFQRDCFHVRRDGFVALSHRLKPDAVVSPQSFSPGEAHQPGAIALIFAPTVAELVKLHFGNRGQPAAKIRPVVKRMKLGGVGDSVFVVVIPDSGCGGWRRFAIFGDGFWRFAATGDQKTQPSQNANQDE